MSDSNKNINDYVNSLIHSNTNSTQTTLDNKIVENSDSKEQNIVNKKSVKVKNTILFFIRNLILVSSIAYIFIYLFKLGNFV